MLPQALLPDPQAFVLESFDVQTNMIRLELRLAQSESTCPDCQHHSARVHSRYTRTLADLPWADCPVQWRLSVRRFFCDNPDCPRRTFTEQAPPTVIPYARRTPRLKEAHTNVACALCGEPGATLTDKLHLKTSPDTLLRAVRQQSEPTPSTPRVVGIDDWAFRKGQRYGTIIIDQERSRPIDLLPDREASTVATWLEAHPGIEIVTRDRASAYAEAVSKGAPHAVQVADRFHLLQNLRDAIQRLLDRQQTVLRTIKDDSVSTAPEPPTSRPRRQSQAALRKEKRLQRYQDIQQLHAEGLSQRAIAGRLKLDRRTVHRYLFADALPERPSRAMEPNILTPFYAYLTQRWNEGCHNATQLWREIRGRGYTGPRVRVYRWSLKQRANAPAETPGGTTRNADSRPGLSARRASWLVVRLPSDLKEHEKSLLEKLLEQCPPAQTAYRLAQDFGAMVRERRSQDLNDWIDRAKASGVAELKNFAKGLERDYDAVQAGLSLAWSNGPTEGHINRLKLIKREMYGRANFDLLRRRVLDGY
jgi:transposase